MSIGPVTRHVSHSQEELDEMIDPELLEATARAIVEADRQFNEVLKAEIKKAKDIALSFQEAIKKTEELLRRMS